MVLGAGNEKLMVVEIGLHSFDAEKIRAGSNFSL